MATIAAINANLTANVKPFEREMRKARGVVDEFVHGLKQNFGKRSTLGELTELLHGAGAIAGVAIAARTFGEIGDKAAEMAEKIASGKSSAEDLYPELLKSVPIIGQFAKGAEGLQRALDGSVTRAEILSRNLEGIQALREKLGGEKSPAGVLRQNLTDIGALQRSATSTTEVAALNQAERMARANYARELARQAEEAHKPVEQMIESLEKQNGVLLLGEKNMALYEASLKGASVAELEHIGELYDSIEAHQETAKAVQEHARQLAEQAEAARRSQEQIQGIVDAAQQAVDLFGQPDWAGGLEQLRELGAGRDVIEHVRSLHEMIDGWNAARELIEQTRTPLEKFREESQRIHDLYQKGYINTDTFERAMRKAREAVQPKLSDFASPGGPVAAERGSAEAATIIARSREQSTADRLLEAAERQIAAQEKMTQAVVAIELALQQIGVAGIA